MKLVKGQRVYHKILQELGTATGENKDGREIHPLVDWDRTINGMSGIVSTYLPSLLVFPENATEDQIKALLAIVTSQSSC